MKKNALLVLGICLLSISNAQDFKQAFVSTDIDHFWKACKKITATEDTALQQKYLQELYIDKGSPGLKSMIEVRNYSNQEFLDAINHYPAFWQSIKPNTLRAEALYTEIEADILKLKEAYPDLKPSTIYFTVGALRSNGTIQEDRVLIGSELALADKSTVIEELPEWRQPFFQDYTPIEQLALLCTHEYIHTQQKELVQNLLSMCLYEGVAEFVSCQVTGKPSSTPAIAFGKANREQVVEQFVTDLYLMSNNNNWLWGENRNELKVRDLGYYIGYEICERYYTLANDKTKAVKDLIELDYTDEKAVERIVDRTKLLPKPLKKLYKDYEKSRPKVIRMAPFKNGSKKVKPGKTKITVHFSKPLNGYNTGIDFGPLGAEHCPKINPQNRVWAEDGTSYTFETDLEPNKKYQILISNNFRMEDGIRLKPYLIELQTAE